MLDYKSLAVADYHNVKNGLNPSFFDNPIGGRCPVCHKWHIPTSKGFVWVALTARNKSRIVLMSKSCYYQSMSLFEIHKVWRAKRIFFHKKVQHG